MKKRSWTLNKKVSMLLLLSLLFTILFSFLFMHFLYKDLYIGTMKESILYQGERTTAHYHYGEVSGDIKDKILWYNVISPYKVDVVDSLHELKENFPYKVDGKPLLSKEDTALLDQGQHIMKEGYVKEFDRDIVGAIFPLMNEERHMGYIYIYIPLAEMTEVFQKGIPILVLAGTMFYFLLFVIIQSTLGSLFKPVKEMKAFSNRVANGDFSQRLDVSRNDEMSELGRTFNHMVDSLENQEERKRQFLSNVAHELRTPLTYIGGYTAVLMDKVHTDPDDAEESLKLIQKESIRMQKLINELLELNKLEDSSSHLEFEPIVLSELLSDTLSLVQPHAREKDLVLEKSLDEETIINGDPDRIRQVVYNVLDNAIKYSKPQGKIILRSSRQGDEALITIRDHGIGIPSSSIPRIGERFYRSDLSRTRNSGGYGLGLSIAKEILHRHGGSLQIESEEGVGTTVTVRIPLLKL
ncbi:ATP-binding protein [Rossellomorea marisflavi]|uniref:sensor histidine kinase n=1 Tax=Rossellomorea marisflavi TaxID=189381 RepID=UPI0028532196|nr:ATP-binding protein [Rossellomorea marisflavi]MDR4936752.1 ATP-binding protein [Rossellomorea marisflavi]